MNPYREHLAEIAAAHEAQSLRAEPTVTPDPALANPPGVPSQYAEGLVAVSGGPALDAEFEAIVADILSRRRMRYFVNLAARGAPSSLAREENGGWERYEYLPARWLSDFHVKGEVLNTGDWQPADMAEVKGHIATYRAANPPA